MIKIRNLTKCYDTEGVVSKVLDSVSLDIKSGEFISLVGRSGSGKSTLMHIIGLLDFASEGEYFFRGRNVSGFNQDELSNIRGKKIGFIFQNFSLLSQYPVWYNVALPLHYQGIEIEAIKNKAQEYLKKVGMEKYLDYYPNMLSGGQKQRVACARALIIEPEIILADEPTGALDSKTGDDLIRLLGKLNKEYNVTILIVTHDQKIANSTVRQLYITDGKLHDK